MSEQQPQFASRPPNFQGYGGKPGLEPDELSETELDEVVGGLTKPLYVPSNKTGIKGETSNTSFSGENAGRGRPQNP